MNRRTILMIAAEGWSECGNFGIWDNIMADFQTHFRPKPLCREFLRHLDEVLK